MKLSQYAREHDLTYLGAWKRWDAGKIPGAYLDESGHVVVPSKAEARLHKAAVYARVSTHGQKDDLDRQAQRMTQYANAQGYQVVAVVTEVASGVNDSRVKLTKLLAQDDWGTLVVEHRDRLTRVGFNWFETFLSHEGRAINVANPTVEDKEDLMQDFTAILYSFTARMYGKRGHIARADKAIKALDG